MANTFRKAIVQRITRNLLDIQILRLVQKQPMWGYMIKKQADTRFNVKLRHGALYPLLGKMEKDGLVTSQKQQKGKRTRKVYTITKKGKEHLETYYDILQEQIDMKDIL